MNYMLGQAIGLAASGISFLNPLYQKKWQMLANNILTNFLLGLNLLLLGQIGSGIFLFCVAVIQSAVNLIHTLKDRAPTKWEKLLFLVLYVGLGLYGLVTAPGYVPGVNWQNIRELLPIGGAVCSMCFVFARKEQTARGYLLCCDSLWSIYNLLIGTTAAVGSLVSATLGVISIVYYRKKTDA